MDKIFKYLNHLKQNLGSQVYNLNISLLNSLKVSRI